MKRPVTEFDVQELEVCINQALLDAEFAEIDVAPDGSEQINIKDGFITRTSYNEEDGTFTVAVSVHRVKDKPIVTFRAGKSLELPEVAEDRPEPPFKKIMDERAANGNTKDTETTQS